MLTKYSDRVAELGPICSTILGDIHSFQWILFAEIAPWPPWRTNDRGCVNGKRPERVNCSNLELDNVVIMMLPTQQKRHSCGRPAINLWRGLDPCIPAIL